MTGTRFWDRGSARRIAAVNAFDLPSSVRQRFAFQHGDMTTDGIGTVESATRQWFRLAARHPKATLSMPSVLVDDMWHELVLHTRDYADFCQTALGRFLHHVPESAMSAPGAAANRSTGLATTYGLACRDEGVGPDALPLLFRVDQEFDIEGGRRYLADCGGRGECFEVRGTVCVKHLTGAGKATRGGWSGKGLHGAVGEGGGGAGAGGCSGGCGGGT
jgi:hypothetical protein